MNIAERIREALLPRAAHDEIADITVGRIYAAVTLASGGFGVAHLGGAHGPRRTPPPPDAGSGPRDPAEVLPHLGGDDPFASALASATASALATADIGPLPEGDVVDRLAVSDGDRVVMVGGFPIDTAIKERGGVLSVFDRGWGIGNMDELPAALSDADIVIVTATAVINNTIDDILEHIHSARETVLLGPSTILIPEAFRGTPVTRLFGIVPRDVSAVRDAVEKGGGTRDFIRHAKKVEAAVPG